MHISGINHITLRTQDLNQSEHFYTQILGLEKVGQRPDMHFYSSGKFAHELALLLDSKYQRNEQDGLIHLCFNVTTEAALKALYRKCRAQGLTTSSGVNHIVMHSFYLRDPDGHTIEIGMDRPSHEWQDNPTPFAEDYPLHLTN